MAKRKIIELPNRQAGNPIPACVTLGNLILPSVIQGNPRNSQDPEKQIEQAFIKRKDVIEAVGETTDNIGKVIVYLKDFQERQLVSKEWLKMFPNEKDRPARHGMEADLQGNVLVQLNVIAAL